MLHQGISVCAAMLALVPSLARAVEADGNSTAAIVSREFVFDSADFKSCHASTIVQSRNGGLLTAFFAGSHEGAPDVGIWICRQTGAKWSAPVRIATGADASGKPLPCYNPVLFQPRKGPLLLFYKVGPSPAYWWGMMMTSDDSGATWSPGHRLPEGILGPIKNKPIELADGTLLCPSSDESDGWKLHLERTSDLGASWTRTPPLNEGHKIRQIQPTLLDYGHGKIQFLSRSDAKIIYQCWSMDSGETWGSAAPTQLPNPNSGIDAVRLSDGRSLLVYNPSATDRHPLAFALSLDGEKWGKPTTIEDTDGPELSYPAVIQTSDKRVHICYTWERTRIRHVIVDPARLP